jgi:hypothetical protein
MSPINEISTTTPNVKMVQDGQGRFWLCDISVSFDSDLASEGCVQADEIIYDRMFGG